MIVTVQYVACDDPDCDMTSQTYTPTDLAAYLEGSTEGKWYVSPKRTVCRGCVIDRACRIFGHRIARLPAALDHSGTRSTCVRCHTYQGAVS